MRSCDEGRPSRRWFSLAVLTGLLGAGVGRAQALKPIVVGQVGSLTHPQVAGPTTQYRAGIALAMEFVNARGGVHGRPLKLVFREDDFDPVKSLDLVKRLVAEDDIVALVGNVGTPSLLHLAQQGTLESLKLASFAPIAGLQSALDKPNVFPVRASYEDELLAMFQHAAQLMRSRVAFLAIDSGVGRSLSVVAAELSQRAGVVLDPPSLFTFEPDPGQQTQAIEQAIDRFAPGRPDAVVLIAAGPGFAAAARSLKARYGLSLPIYCLGWVTPTSVVKAVGLQMARGIMLTQVMPSPSTNDVAIVRDFQTQVLAQSPAQEVSYTLLEGFVAGRIAAEIVRRSPKPSRDAVLQTALTTGDLSVVGFRVAYAPRQRRSLQKVDITIIGASGTLLR